jgi:cation:H+ antiporter
VTSVLAARKGEGDLALGNVLGSNLFNLLFILGTVAFLTDVPLPPGAGVSLLALLGLTLLLFPLSISFDWTITRCEGLLLVACYLAFLGYQLWQALRMAL